MRKLAIGFGSGLVAAGAAVVAFSSDPGFAQWLMPTGLTISTIASVLSFQASEDAEKNHQ